MSLPLPRSLTLPSGRVVRLVRPSTPAPVAAEGGPLFRSAALALGSGLAEDPRGAPLDVDALPLRDFHVLRAVLTRSELVDEERLETTCSNCEAALALYPCRALEIGAWVDGEHSDPELDATLPFGEPVSIPAVPLGRVRTATTVTFADRTVRQASALFAALGDARAPLVIDAAVVDALGLVALGPETDPARIARALREADDEAFAAIGSAFTASHYPARLGAFVRCGACGARNEVDAPEEREFYTHHADAVRVAGPGGHAGFPDFATFADRAQQLAAPMQDEPALASVALVIEDGVADVDEGGSALLGAYVPPTHRDDMAVPAAPPTVTVYYRTFRAVWEEEGPYDWEAELEETLEHELEHHVYFLRGADPMDDEERAVLLDEATRLVGPSEARRRELTSLGASVVDFVRRTWPLWVLCAVVLVLTLLTQR